MEDFNKKLHEEYNLYYFLSEQLSQCIKLCEVKYAAKIIELKRIETEQVLDKKIISNYRGNDKHISKVQSRVAKRSSILNAIQLDMSYFRLRMTFLNKLADTYNIRFIQSI